VLAAAALLLAGGASSAGSYSDPAGDDNAAPDITSVSVADALPDDVVVTVTTSNEPTLSRNAWFNLWFDLDADSETGVAGSDALVRYFPDMVAQLFVWNGSTLVERPATDVTGAYEAGALTMNIPKAALGGRSAFGILVVSGKRQALGAAAFTASDFAPDLGHFRWPGTPRAAFPDPDNDHVAAPDITSVKVTDAVDGWVRFAVTTTNYEKLRNERVVVLWLDTDSRSATGEYGVDAAVVLSDDDVQVLRADASQGWTEDEPPTRVRTRTSANVVTIEVHRSELGTSGRLRFRLTAASIDSASGAALAVDLAPNNGSFWRYGLTSVPAVRLVAGKAVGVPAGASPGKPFEVRLRVRRSDTGREITSGTATCRVRVGGRSVRAKGSLARGVGRCSFVVPASAAGKTVRGSITVRSGGKSVTAGFSTVVGTPSA